MKEILCLFDLKLLEQLDIQKLPEIPARFLKLTQDSLGATEPPKERYGVNLIVPHIKYLSSDLLEGRGI